MESTIEQTVVIIGASHAGVSCAFALKKEGWQGAIILYDSDPNLPYHRPPLSKAYLTDPALEEKQPLKPEISYQKEQICLKLGVTITGIDSQNKTVTYGDGAVQSYNILVLATGAKPFFPPISGIRNTPKVFPLRSLDDVKKIKSTIDQNNCKNSVIIGGGYIGLETAASLQKLGIAVTVLESEERILARVTSVEVADYFTKLHTENGVKLLTKKTAVSIKKENDQLQVNCEDGTTYPADLVIHGCGIQVTTTLAEMAGIALENGIKVNAACKTSNNYIYAIGDCTYHFNPHYQRFVRLESVQNALDQAKVAAASICKKNVVYDAIPWFWSDQYDRKLQMVGLSKGYDNIVVRHELENQKAFSVWYFKADQLLAVDAINNPKAYVMGTKLIKNRQKIDRAKLADTSLDLKLAIF